MYKCWKRTKSLNRFDSFRGILHIRSENMVSRKSIHIADFLRKEIFLNIAYYPGRSKIKDPVN